MKLLTINAAAEVLSVSPDTIRRMLPRLGAVDLNGGRKGKRLIRIPEERIKDYLHDCTILPPVPSRQARPTEFHLERRRA